MAKIKFNWVLGILLLFLIIIGIVCYQNYYLGQAKVNTKIFNQSNFQPDYVEIKSYEIRNLFNLDKNTVILLDRTYRAYDLKDINNSISKLRFKSYEKEIYDCDDFAFESMTQFKRELPGVAIGILSVSETIQSKTFSSYDEMEAEYVAFNKSLNYGEVEIEKHQNYGKWYLVANINHGVNVIIDSENNIWYFDPQDRKLIKFENRPLKQINMILL